LIQLASKPVGDATETSWGRGDDERRGGERRGGERRGVMMRGGE
jgi:hypothetical protein